jgi:hypothetical protein
MPKANACCLSVRGSNFNPHTSVAISSIAMIQIANLFGIISVPNKNIDSNVKSHQTRYNASEKCDDDLGCKSKNTDSRKNANTSESDEDPNVTNSFDDSYTPDGDIPDNINDYINIDCDGFIFMDKCMPYINNYSTITILIEIIGMLLCASLPSCSLTTTMKSVLLDLQIIAAKWVNYLIKIKGKSDFTTTKSSTDVDDIPTYQISPRVDEPLNGDFPAQQRLVNFEENSATSSRELGRDSQLSIPQSTLMNENELTRVVSPRKPQNTARMNPRSFGTRVVITERPERYIRSSARSTISRAPAPVRQIFSMHTISPQRPVRPEASSGR